MKKIQLLLFMLMAGLIGQAQTNSLTQVIRGVVLDEQSGSPLAGVSIHLNNSDLHAVTDSLGNFEIRQVPIGRQSIQASATGYEQTQLSNIEFTSSKEVVVEIRLKERVTRLNEVVVKSSRLKTKAINEMAIVSARQLSTDEAFRFSGTRNDPSRMAQNFAGVSGSNDARNDIIIRGNSPAGVLWRMDGIDIPNPNHFSTLGSTGGPVSILNINTLKNSDFLTSAFPASYGNALAGVFDLRLRNGNTEKTEFTGQMGFNGFEGAIEGPFSKKSKASYLVDYRYSMVAALQKIGLEFGTGSATPYYQDITFKVNLPTKKAGTFSLFGLGGESHIEFLPDSQSDDNLYSNNDGSVRTSKFKSKTGVLGLSHLYFYNKNSSAKTTLSVSGYSGDYKEAIVETGKSDKPSFIRYSEQLKYAISHTFNKKFNARYQLTAGVTADINQLQLKQDYLKDADSTLTNLLNSSNRAILLKAFANLGWRFNNQFSSNIGLYAQHFDVNNSQSIEPRFNLKYQLRNNQALSFGVGLHSQTQPLDVYFYQTSLPNGSIALSNKELDFVKSLHGVLGYDVSVSRHFRLKTEVYGQYIYDAAVEKTASSFSLLNSGSNFGFPDKTNLVNNGKGYNYGLEITAERFLHQGLYYLFTVSLFESKYKGSDGVWRNTAFNSNYVINALGGKEWKLNNRSSFGVDSKVTVTGGQRYTPFDVNASLNAGFTIYKEDQAFSSQNAAYFRWDLKFSYIRNGRKVTQKWYVDFQNVTGQKNIYVRTLNTKTGNESRMNQMGFFPNVNYQITF